jgi:hypothetical protein
MTTGQKSKVLDEKRCSRIVGNVQIMNQRIAQKTAQRQRQCGSDNKCHRCEYLFSVSVCFKRID